MEASELERLKEVGRCNKPGSKIISRYMKLDNYVLLDWYVSSNGNRIHYDYNDNGIEISLSFSIDCFIEWMLS